MSSYQVTFTYAAYSELLEKTEYIEDENTRARYVADLMAHCHQKLRLPLRTEVYLTRKERQYRRIYFKAHTVAFYVSEDERRVYVARVFHSAELYKNKL